MGCSAWSRAATKLRPSSKCAIRAAGIPPEIRDKIFNLYFTTKKAGSGIGLAMSYRVLQLHNGGSSFRHRNGSRNHLPPGASPGGRAGDEERRNRDSDLSRGVDESETVILRCRVLRPEVYHGDQLFCSLALGQSSMQRLARQRYCRTSHEYLAPIRCFGSGLVVVAERGVQKEKATASATGAGADHRGPGTG